MQSEIFRFGVIRNSRKLSKSQKELLNIKIDFDPDHRSQPHKAMKLIHSHLDDINSISADAFYADVKPMLFNNETEFIESNAKNEKILTLTYELQKIATANQFADKKLGTLLKTPLNKTDKAKLEDSIVYGIFRPYEESEWNEISKEILRANHIIEKLNLDKSILESSSKLYKLINSIVILPKAIFPLPNNKEEKQKENKIKAKRHRQKLKKIVDDKNKEIKELHTAIEEVSTQHSKFLKDVKNEGGEDHRSLTKLSKPYLDKMSDSTIKILKRSSLIADSDKLEEIDVVESTRSIENVLLNFNKTSALDFHAPDLVVDGGIRNAIRPGPCGTLTIDTTKAENEVDFNGGKAEFAGIMDLKKVKQELFDYRPGEIAHIENVLKGEKKSKKHRKLNRTEETIFEESETTEEIEKHLETTDRYELQREAERTISEETSKEAGVNITADYGKVKMEANASISSDKSVENSNKSASTYSKDVINKSVQKVKERILNRRSQTTISEVEIINKHSIDNSDLNSQNIAGKYFWMNKYYKAQLMNYGERAILSFMVPEPAAFYKFARDLSRKTEELTPPEIPSICNQGQTVPLQPTDITTFNYLYWIGKYNVEGIEPPPQYYKKVSSVSSIQADKTSEKNAPINIVDSSISVPDGYSAKLFSYIISGASGNTSLNGGEDHDDMLFLSFKINKEEVFAIYKNEIGELSEGNITYKKATPLNQLVDWSNSFDINELKLGSYKRGRLKGEIAVESSLGKIGTIPVSVAGINTLPIGVTMHVNVLCIRNIETYIDWQIKTYNSINSAYQALKLEYEENLAQREFATEVNIQGQNPLINRKTEETELKRQVISIMSGQHFEGFNAMEQDHSKEGVHRFPQMDLMDAEKEGPFVRFFEQSFEWHNMIYNFYPYFWGRKENWVKQQHINDVDFQFEQFLKAGYAKVEVPIRRGFEKEVFEKIQIAQMGKNGTDISVLTEGQESENYLAVIDEILDSLGHEYGEQPEGTISIDHNSNFATGSGTKLEEKDIDREIIIDLKSYRIRDIDEASQKITLDRKYKSDKTDADEQNLENVGYWLGAKFVGEPWLVEVPTSLVILK